MGTDCESSVVGRPLFSLHFSYVYQVDIAITNAQQLSSISYLQPCHCHLGATCLHDLVNRRGFLMTAFVSGAAERHRPVRSGSVSECAKDFLTMLNS